MRRPLRVLALLALLVLGSLPLGAAEPGLPKGVAWVRELASEATAGPVLDGDRVFLRSAEGVHAFRAGDGAALWSAPVPGEEGLAAASGTVVASGTALDGASGRVLWKVSPEPRGAHLEGGRVWALEQGVLVARDLRTGEIRFRLAEVPGVLDFEISGSRIVLAGEGFASLWDVGVGRLAWRRSGILEAAALGAGALLLEKSGRLERVGSRGRTDWSLRGPYEAARVLDAGRVALLAGSGRLEVREGSGRLLWTSPHVYDLQDLHDLGGGLVLLAGEYGGASLREVRTGRVLRRIDDSPAGPAARLGGRVHVLGGSGTLYRLEEGTGRFLPGFRHEVPEGGWGLRQAAVGDGRAFLLRGGSLVALGPGPGLRHGAAPPSVVLTVPSPQLPGTASLTLCGRFTRLVALQVFRMEGSSPRGDPVVSRVVPLPAGSETRERSLSVPLPGPGTWLVTARSGPASARAVLTATGLGLTAKLAPEGLLVHAQDTRTGRPAPGVLVEVRRAGTLVGSGRTDPSGASRLPAPVGEGEVVVSASWKGQSIRFPFTPEALDWSHALFLETDRPIYRPGQRVHYRGVVMRDRGGELQVASGAEAVLEIRDSADNLLDRREVRADEAGTFSGELALAGEPPLGRYRLEARAAGSTRGFQLPFEVQEYRKPPFQVEVRPGSPLVVGARSLAFHVAARRWFGGAVPGAPLSWRLERQRLYAGEEGPDDEDGPGPRGWREFVAEGTAALDGEGRATLDLQVPPPAGEDFAYTLQVEVTGPEGRAVPGSARVLVSTGEFSVVVSPRSWLARPGQATSLEVRTRDLLGQGHAARVRLEFLEERWTRQGTREVRRGAVLVQTDAAGLGRTSWTPSAPGYYRVEATARDGAGRVLKGRTWVWVPGTGEMAWEGPTLRLIPERRTARPGEKLRVLILADRPGTLLWTVEGARLFDHRAVPLAGPATVVEVPIRAEHAPEIHLEATLPGRDEPVSAGVRIRVLDSSHEVRVELAPDREDYRPGGTARIGIRTTRAGQPVAASLSVALVDEAIFALREDAAGSIHRFFYGRRENRVQTFHLMPRGPSAAGFQTVEGPAPVRSEFQDTAFWSARVLTGPDGRGSVQVPLPDDLTRWRATARAVAPPDGVGQAVSHLVTRLPLMIQVVAPRFLVEGDRSALLAVVHNRTAAPVEARVELKAEGAALAPGPGRVDVAAGATGRETARIEVPPGRAEVSLEARVQAGPEGDAERIRVPVQPRGLRRDRFFGAVVPGRLDWDFEVPPGATRARLEVRADGSAAAVVLGALGYLVGYPYGCVEQTMSRFLPTVVASQATTRMGQPLGLGDLKPQVTAGLQKLYGYQHSDGGWGWWESDATHPFMTGYVVMGLARAREAGWEVSEPVLQRGVEATRRLLAESPDPELQAWLAWALAEAGQPPVEALAGLARRAEDPGTAPSLGTFSRALVTLALVRAGQAEPARRLALGLRAGASLGSDGAHWPAKSPTPYGWTDDEVSSTSLVVRALQEALGPEEPLVARGVDWLVLQRRGSAWASTLQTAQAVLALSRFLEARGATGVAGPVEVTWNGQVLGVMDPARPSPRPIELEGLPPGPHRLGFRASSGAPVASARLAWYEPLRDEGEAHGVTVTRRFLDEAGRPRVPLGVRPGERLQVELTVTAPRPLDCVLLEDPRAAGVEPVPEEEEGWRNYDRREDRDERTVFFFTSLPRGQTRVVYQVRAETPGRFTVLPARAEGMYRPEVWGTSAPATLEIP